MIDYTDLTDPFVDHDQYSGMNDDQRFLAACLQATSFIVAIMVGLLICALLGSCSTTMYVPVPEYHTDTLIITKQQRDSVWVWCHDSIVTNMRSDTVTIERWHWRDRWREREVHDTTYMSKTDTVPVPYPVGSDVAATDAPTSGEHLLWLLGIGVVIWIVSKKVRR